jgi:hypothetical protein
VEAEALDRIIGRGERPNASDMKVETTLVVSI